MLAAELIYLGETEVSQPLRQVRAAMCARFTEEVVRKRIHHGDWVRTGIVLDWVRGCGSILDIGAGQGLFVNALALTGAAETIRGIDIRDYSLYSELWPGFERIMVDAEQMPFADGAFDTVVCMEVIEHLPDGKLERVLAQARRVARRRLILSVPLCEPLPLSKYHCQQFLPGRIAAMFPGAKFTILLKKPVDRSVPWIVIDETRDRG